MATLTFREFRLLYITPYAAGEAPLRMQGFEASLFEVMLSSGYGVIGYVVGWIPAVRDPAGAVREKCFGRGLTGEWRTAHALIGRI
jgi:hypothetical protein